MPAFHARWPWIGADLQTLRNFVVRRQMQRPGQWSERLEIALDDGSGDRLLGWVDHPATAVTRSLVVLVHGLTGCSESSYMHATAASLLDAGHRVLRLNLRGAGHGRAIARRHYHAGCSQDLRAVLAALPDAFTACGVTAVGFSLGGNVLLKHLGEAGPATAVRAAVSVSAPIDLAACSARLRAPRNILYQRYLLSRMKRDAAAMASSLTPEQLRAVDEVRDVYGYDDRVVAPSNGFSGAVDYYARSSAAGFLPHIGIPTLLVHALNDPWIPADIYRGVDWSSLPRLRTLLPASGGHVGFHAAGSRVAWHDRAIIGFLAQQETSVPSRTEGQER